MRVFVTKARFCISKYKSVSSSMESSKVLENRRIDMLARRNLYVLLSNRCPIAG